MLEFRRGRGVSVLRAPDPHAALIGHVRELLEEAARYGLRPLDVIDLIQTNFIQTDFSQDMS
ncbi:hypothetical protein J5X84_06060 [Streptosporangiaceae bacterium NEAU-GS5]|nr:hypothetical protein [Streptosporangiaceae bacterium NEAU-GS5]